MLLREPGGVAAVRADPRARQGPGAARRRRAPRRCSTPRRAHSSSSEALEPRLAAGGWVLLDRFVDSSLAYQGGGARLGIAEVAAVNAFATGGLRPDRTLLLRIDPALGRSRQAGRGEAADRLEQEDERFFRAIAAAYDDLAASEPERVRVVDASADPETVLSAAIEALSDI